jgi:ferredoxin-NADP reductase
MIATVNFVVQDSYMITPNVKHIALLPQDGLDFTFIPGQFITVHFEKGGHPLKRSYSIATIPGKEKAISFAASYVKDGPGSEYLFSLKPGDTVQVSGPFGRLILKDEDVKRLFLISTGTGVTPYRAMLPLLTEKMRQQPDLKVVIMEGVQYRQDVLYPEDFLAWEKAMPGQAEYRAYLSREELSVQRAAHEHPGYVQLSFDEFQVSPETDIFYLCGNPNMIDDAFAKLQAVGFATSQIRREKYISSK